MRLYGAIQKVEPQDDGTVCVYGIATSEAVDDQGEIVRADAMRAAIPEYMRFPALREMHQLSAAGTTLEAEVCDDGTTRIVAHVVDPVAVAKVKNGVYRGFSIGGRVLQREAGNPKTITGLMLNEISLVDRPANPEAVFDCWKAALAADAPLEGAEGTGPGAKSTTPMRESGSRGPFNSPIQIWACEVADHRHIAKLDAVKCIEKHASGMVGTQTASDSAKTDTGKPASGAFADPNRERDEISCTNSAETSKPYGDVQYADPGYQADKKKRYPIDTIPHIRAAWNYINNPVNARKYTDDQLKRIKPAIVAAWREKIDKDGPPSGSGPQKGSRASLTKALEDVDRIARMVIDLEWMGQALDVEAMIENDNLPQTARLQDIVAELCDFLSALVMEAAGDIEGDAETDGSPFAPPAPDIIAEAARRGTRSADLLAKAKHSRGDQALLDMARLACDKCLKMRGLTVAETENLRGARDSLDKAGAFAVQNFRSDMMDDARNILPPFPSSPNVNGAVHMLKALGVIAAVLGKAGRIQKCMMDMAHECLRELTDGMTCSEAAKVGARHSSGTMQHLKAAHRHLVAAGAECNAATVPETAALSEAGQMDDAPSGKGVRSEDLVKALTSERAEKEALGQVLTEIMPMLERLTQRVDEIARTPLPPLTIAKGTVSVSKQQDLGSIADSDPVFSQEAVAAALAKMSKEEQTLTLIKASYANPIRTGADER
jgi:hypothetical protein